VEPYPRVINNSAHLVDSVDRPIRNLVDKAVVAVLPLAYLWSCPEGLSRIGDTEIASRFTGSDRSLRALLCPYRAARKGSLRGLARRDVIGIPVSILPSGEKKHGPRPSSPWTLAWRPVRP